MDIATADIRWTDGTRQRIWNALNDGQEMKFEEGDFVRKGRSPRPTGSPAGDRRRPVRRPYVIGGPVAMPMVEVAHTGTMVVTRASWNLLTAISA